MPELRLRSIKFGDPGMYHFVTLTSGEHKSDVIEDRHDIDIEVMVPSSTRLDKVEEIALNKARTLVKQLAASF